MSKQRRRDTTLTIRLTKAEKERIERNAKRAGRSITDYLVLLSLETPIHVAEDVKPLLIELKRIGNNLNQITAKINAGVFRSYNFEDMIDGRRKSSSSCWTLRGKDNGNGKFYFGIGSKHQRNESSDRLLLTAEKGGI